SSILNKLPSPARPYDGQGLQFLNRSAGPGLPTGTGPLGNQARDGVFFTPIKANDFPEKADRHAWLGFLFGY
ncbi:MAG: hypothetical protein ACE10K_16070, partial [Rhodothermales bacterium]